MADGQDKRRDDQKRRDEARHLHEMLGFVGLRAQATAVGFLTLLDELLKAGVIDGAAIERIKAAVYTDITVSRTAPSGRDEFERTLRKRLDALFPKAEGDGERAPVGHAGTMPGELGETAH
jgi:hypothetical protein